MVATPSFTLLDDPLTHATLAPACTTARFGLSTKVLIEKGQLRGFVYDTVSARRAGTASTGSAVRGGSPDHRRLGVARCNWRRHVDQAEILRRVGNGVFVESLIGVHSGVNPSRVISRWASPAHDS